MCVDLGDHSSLLREVRSLLALLGAHRDSSCTAAGMNRASSRVEEGTSGFLSISDFNCRVSADLEQESQASSCVEAWNCACLSRCSWGVRPLVKLDLSSVAFSRGYNRDVSAPSCCDFILDVTFEDVSGNLDLP